MGWNAVAVPDPSFREITVGGTDYAFLVADTLEPGLTAVAFDNHGRVRHEMGLTLLRPGKTLPDVFAAESLRTPDDSIYGPDAGVLFAGAGETPGGRLLVNLVSGGTYLMWCDFQDAPDQPQHSDLGMIRTVVVR